MNWKDRIKNKTFWITLIPAVLLLVQVIAVPLGYNFEISGLNDQLLAIVNAAFAVLSILGIVIDPTVAGIKDKKEEDKK